MNIMEKLQNELQELQNLEAQGLLDDSQTVRLQQLPSLIEIAKIEEAKTKELQSALAQKDHFREKAEKAVAERKVLEAKLNAQPGPSSSNSLNIEDYIDISASLDGLDQREKEYIAQLHKQTGVPLSEIRKNEDFQLWQSAYQAKVEKERAALRPTNNAGESDRPMSFEAKLASASMAEKEQLLREAGLLKETRKRDDRVKIGS